MVNIRQAKIEDTEKIVDININSWISTYKDIVPKDVIEKRKTNRNEIINRWKKKIEEDQSFYVIEDNQEIFGFVSFGNSYNEKYKDYGEIYSLYLKDNYCGHGYGKKLIEFAISKLKEKYHNIIVCCLTDNSAINFYQKQGAKPIENTFKKYDDKKLKLTILKFEK